MRTIIDAHRSLARYLAEVLPEYDVWQQRMEPQEDRPYAVVKPIQVPTINQPSRVLVDVVQPFVVYLYPQVANTATEGQHAKFLTEEALFEAFHIGIGLAYPGRIPLLDYTTGGSDETLIPWGQPAPDPVGRPDYMRVTSYGINSAQDINDERRWSITLTVRLAWRRYGRIFSGVPAQGIKIKAETTR